MTTQAGPAGLSAAEVLFSEGQDAYRPDPPYTVSEWADKHRVLSSVAAAESGAWRTSRTPYLREIMDSLSSYSAIERVVVMKGAQLGVSEAALNFVGYCIHHSPGPMLYVMPTLDGMKKLSRTRVDPMIAESAALSERIKPARARDSGNTLLSKDFDGGTLIMTGSNAGASLRSMPIRFLALDEVDAYPASAGDDGDPVMLAIKRTTNFVRRKILMLSTPLFKDHSRIGRAFREGDQRYYNVECDECGTLQPITWAQIKWQDKDASTAEFECAVTGCRHRHPEHRKTALLAGGEWIPTAEAVRPGIRSYHLSGLYSPWFKWSDAVAEFLDAKGDPALLQVFTNTVLGEEWDNLGGERIDPESLLAKREDFGEMVPSVAVQTVGVDVQPDRLELERVGWGRDEESWSLDYQIFTGDPDGLEVWDQLDDYLKRRWEHPAFPGGLGIAAVAIDTGGSNTQAVYRFVGPREGRRVWGIKGYSGKRPIWPRRPSRNNKGRINLFPIGVDTAKEIVANRLTRIGAAQAGAGACHFPMERDHEHFEQLTAEVLITRYSKGFAVPEWHKRRERNEALDARVYAYAALQGLFSMGGNLNREAAKVERVLQEKGLLVKPADEAAPVEAEPETIVDEAPKPSPTSQEAPRKVLKKKRRRVITSPYHN